MVEDSERICIQCKDCPFERVVDPEETRPADVVVEHGQRTGHTLSISNVDD